MTYIIYHMQLPILYLVSASVDGREGRLYAIQIKVKGYVQRSVINILIML